MGGTAITEVLSVFGDVITVLLGSIAQIATFLISNPLTVIALMFTIAGVGFNVVRSWIRN